MCVVVHLQGSWTKMLGLNINVSQWTYNLFVGSFGKCESGAALRAFFTSLLSSGDINLLLAEHLLGLGATDAAHLQIKSDWLT